MRGQSKTWDTYDINTTFNMMFVMLKYVWFDSMSTISLLKLIQSYWQHLESLSTQTKDG